MKAQFPKLIAATGLLFALVMNLHSQVAAKSPVDRMRDIKAANAAQIDKQTATLEKLDEMDKAAEQLRFFSKRS